MKTPSVSISSLALIAVLLSASFVTAQTPSLWPQNRSKSMIANKVAAQRGDILTIVLSESTTVSNAQNMQTTKESTINNQVGQFLFSAAASGFGTHNGELPATNMSGASEATRSGNVSNTATLADRFSVMVDDVLPNGNLVLVGTRKRSYGGETQFVVFSGIARYWDVQGNNTIDSNLIHNAQVEYITEGALSDAQKKGWLERINEVLNPF